MAPTVEARRIRANPLVRELIAMSLDADQFVVFGSAPLLAHGLRAQVRDLDIVARGAVMQWAQERGTLGVGTHSGDPVWQHLGGRIQFSTGWISDRWDVGELIENAEVIDGLRFACLRDVLSYKQELRRPKDLVDIRAIQTHLTGTSPTAVG